MKVSDVLIDVDVLDESEMLVLVEPLTDVLALFDSLTLIDVDALSDVDVLVESETLVLVESLNDVLVLFESLTLMDVL
ncbi:MAG: hypothetical protein E6632_03350, partial [Staphylococcus epidermidis]|nr:hypothetical protein [Staphylococcus epidermidis]MDU6183180.1 hypothetical protein [Staphylococcus epidermidis]